jgi:hypothetical protein
MKGSVIAAHKKAGAGVKFSAKPKKVKGKYNGK